MAVQQRQSFEKEKIGLKMLCTQQEQLWKKVWVAGGGSLLAKRAKAKLKKDKGELSIGHKILYSAACEPLKQIAANCGSVPEVVLEKIVEKPKDFGYNGMNGEVCNLMKAGIVDPAKVTRLALQNASSVAINLLSIGCAMVSDEQ